MLGFGNERERKIAEKERERGGVRGSKSEAMSRQGLREEGVTSLR